ncbi:MAG: response regulator [Desulfovibrionaceae bacterium]|nr:response regulator [Desulfovibrionaceae bacterium]MBF0513712.1 response regulator [Desulfovibrionaceae bacterium]
MEIDRSIPILIVDDNQAMRRLLADIVRNAGFKNLVFAEDGMIALQKLGEASFSLVFLDWDMPRKNGLEVLEAMRASEALAHVPVIMVTAKAEQDKVMAAIAGGVSNYVVKPYTPNSIYKKMQAVLCAKDAV